MRQLKEKGEKALPSAPPPCATKEGERKEGLAKAPAPNVTGKKALTGAPSVDPPTSKRCTRRTFPRETTPFGVGDWLTDKDTLCWFNQELCHMVIDETHVWTLVHGAIYQDTVQVHADS